MRPSNELPVVTRHERVGELHVVIRPGAHAHRGVGAIAHFSFVFAFADSETHRSTAWLPSRRGPGTAPAKALPTATASSL